MMTPHEAADELRGTANNFDEVVGCEMTDMSKDWLAEFEELVFLCEICDWWCDTDELTDNQACEECAI